MATLKEKIERRLLRKMLSLPEAAQRALFGAPPRNDDGAPLDLQTHVLLSLMQKTGQPDIHELGVVAARELYAESLELLDFSPVLEAHDFDANGVTVRVYEPDAGVGPCLVYYHGGGFTIGRAREYDGLCSRLARATGWKIASVDYRLAPESRFPAAVEDSVKAYRWVRDHAELLGHDGTLLTGGDSAGGNLAAVVSQELLNAGEALPELQVLIFPATDDAKHYESADLFREGFFLTTATREWFSDTYVGDADRSDPRVSPIYFDRHGEMPETYIVTAGFDPLRDQGRAYARALRDAGATVHERSEDQLVHGYITQGGVIDAARRAIDDMAAEVVQLVGH